jgi:UDP-N-acetylglucosamine 2-epimerase
LTRIQPISAQGYLDFLALLKNACMVVTDSGGVQKEAYWLGIPCLTLREETEWVETVAAGWNLLVGADGDKIAEGMSSFRPSAERPDFYGRGQAGRKVLKALSEWRRKRLPAR